MAVVVDTHTAAWYVTADDRLSADALRSLSDAISSGEPILLPSICLVEMTYLVEKHRIPPIIRQTLVGLLAQENSPFELATLDFRVATALERIARLSIPDLPDRVIAATALAFDAPLVTCDGMIRASGIPTIW